MVNWGGIVGFLSTHTWASLQEYSSVAGMGHVESVCVRACVRACVRVCVRACV